MSKTSIRSKASIRSLFRQKKRKNGEENGRKQYGFCCAIGDYDPLTEYDQRNPPFKSSLTAISVHECPVLKVRTQFIENGASVSKKKGYKIKTGSSSDQLQWVNESKITSAPGALLKFLEDDIELAINKQKHQKQKTFEEEGEKNIITGTKKAIAKKLKRKRTFIPNWYQDFSNAQMKNLMVLRDALCADYEEKETYRTQKILIAIGIISTLFKLAPNQIKTLQQKSNLKPVEFLREIYAIITGTDFETEGHKNHYNCNERLTLSAIAFLTLPETIIELNDRMPPIKIPKFPPKPRPPRVVYPQKMDCPYKEKLFVPPNLRLYQLELHTWRSKCKIIPRPKVILPPKEKSSMCDDTYNEVNKESERRIDEQSEKIRFRNIEEQSIQPNEKQNKNLLTNNDQTIEKENQEIADHRDNSKTSKEQFDFTLSGLGDGVGPVQYKINGILDPSERKFKSWLGEKNLHYVISGILNEDEPPQGPVAFELTGLAKVTPNNSNEDFFAKLKLGVGPKKIYPRGRKYLSKNWQEWLLNVDEEFIKVENEANKLIESVEATMRLVVPGPTCDSCCACRQTRKTNLKKHATKTPHMVIESIVEDSDKKRYIVGSLSMQSPAPSLAESTVNLLEVVGSHDKISKNLLINGITNDNGETIYYISGVTKDIEHVPEEKIEKIIPKSIKNVPACACAIEKIFNEGLDQEPSNDNIELTKDGLCFGKKYRPVDGPAYTCKQYPGDKSCGRNPFQKMLQENKRKARMQKIDKDFYLMEERDMFSLPAFQPCGDEDGMAICGGPWGAVNIPDAEELARRELEEKEILKAPPCGEKPGQSVCGGPWGTRVPKPIPPKKVDEDEDEDEEEEEEDEEEETKVKEKPVETQIIEKKAVKRDKHCLMNSDNLKDKSESPEDNTAGMKLDSIKCGDEDDWDAKRTAPSVREIQSLYERNLNLTQGLPHHSDTIKKYNKGKQMKSEDKELIEIRNKKDSEQPQSSQIFPIKSVPEEEIKKKGIQSKKTNIMSRPKNDQKKRGSNSKNILEVSKIRRKRSVNSTKKSVPAKMRKNQNSEDYNNERGTKTNITEEEKNIFSKGSTSKLTKNTNRSSLKIAKKGEYFQEKTKSGNINRESSHNYGRAKLEKLAQSRREKLQQLKEEMRNFAMLPEMEIQPAVIPEEKPKLCKREMRYVEPECCELQSLSAEEGQISRKEGPFGWRTESEQKLPPEKTLIYLTEPTYPMETVPVRPGGKPCHCRENRNKKKILKYNIGGLLNKAEGEKRKKVQNITQVIEGLTYVTPPPSPRRSDEYIPEYEIYESPYDMCVRQKKDDGLKFTEKFVGLPSLKSNIPKNQSSCNCGYEDVTDAIYSNENKNQLVEKKEAASNEWTNALKDDGLVDFFAGSRDNVPCWLKCSQFSKTGSCDKNRRLQVKKPVCECKYERKIVKRNEDKKNWIDRQKRLKSYKKIPFTHIAGISRPMEPDKRFIISGVKKISKENGDDEVQYCVSGIAENYKMGPVQYLTDGVNMQTPIITPKPSEKNIPCVCAHKHWSVTQLPENLVLSKNGGEAPHEIEENHDEICPRRCNDAAKCKELSNMKADYTFRKKGNTVNNKENDIDEIETERRKTKVWKKADDNVIPDSATILPKVLNKHTRIESVLKTSQNPKHIDNPDSNQNQTKLKTETKKVKHYNPGEESDLLQIVVNELQEMAAEGFIFAKLPMSHRIPQIYHWIMYRKGVLLKNEDSEEMMQRSMKAWTYLKVSSNRSIKPPSFNLKDQQLASLNFDKAYELKREIAEKKECFYNRLRQDRVEKSAALWNTMEFGKFPSLSFKETYFTYLPGKEADGHILEP